MEPRHEMRGADEGAEQAVPVDVALEEGDATPAEKIASLPVAARLRVDRKADEAAIGGRGSRFVSASPKKRKKDS